MKNESIKEDEIIFKSPLKVFSNAIDTPDTENIIIAFYNLQDHYALTKGKETTIINAMEEAQLTQIGKIYTY